MRNRTDTPRLVRALAAVWILALCAGVGLRALASCSGYGLPFTDLGSESTFCGAIAEAYFSGLTNGTSATTYAPSSSVPRDQMAAFITRTLDQSLLRGSSRAGLDQWWTSQPHFDMAGLGTTNVGALDVFLKSDGADVWVTVPGGGKVSRIRASDGKKLEEWNGASVPECVLVALGRIFITGETMPGHLYMIDPSQTASTVTTVSSTIGDSPAGIAFDGTRIWTANLGGSVSIVTPGSWNVTTVTTGFTEPEGILFDGTNVWVTDFKANVLLRLDENGAILQTVAVGKNPAFPAFDGHNLWVPNGGDSSLTVVRASDGAVLKTFSAANGNQNGLAGPIQAAFDGQRVAVSGGGISLFKAADLSIIGHLQIGGTAGSNGICSDGLNFWVTLPTAGEVGRF